MEREGANHIDIIIIIHDNNDIHDDDTAIATILSIMIMKKKINDNEKWIQRTEKYHIRNINNNDSFILRNRFHSFSDRKLILLYWPPHLRLPNEYLP